MCRGTHRAVDLKARRQDGVLGPRGYQRLDVFGMSVGFLGRDETSPHAHTSRARLQNGGDASRSADSTCGENGHRHSIQNPREKGQQAELATNVSSRLDALGADEVAPRFLGADGPGPRANFPWG